jgi:chlorobactene glucosyltransferase
VICVVCVEINVRTIPRLAPLGPPAGPSRLPRVSVVIPARDEEADIEAAVRSHLFQDYPDFEVIVVDDRSGDATPAILARLASEDPRLKVVSGVEPPDGWLGKPHALHEGAREASGELLLFADADVRYDPTAMSEAVAMLEGRRIDLLAFFPRLEMVGFWENALMSYLAVSYFFGPAFWVNSDFQRRYATGGGAGMLMRRDAYRASGGHAALRTSVIDDMGLAIRVRRAGFRCRMVMADERVRLRMYRGFREIFDGFTKNLAFVFEGAVGAFLAASTLFTFVAWILPAAVLVAAAFGGRLPTRDVVLAGVAFGLTALARARMALFVRYPLWTSVTQPVTAAVWAAISVRSFVRRFVRRQVVWRGRSYDAARIRF